MSSIDEIDKVAEGGGGPIWGGKSTNIGDKITGTIIDLTVSQQIDMNTKAPKTFPDGNPMMQVVVTLQTALRDGDEDDGVRRLFAKRGKEDDSNIGLPLLNAITKACKDKSVKLSQALGGELTVKYTGEATPTTKGFNGAKLYKAAFLPGMPVSADVDDL